MNDTIITTLSDPLFEQLQKETFLILNTIDAETGRPTSNAISWLYAVSPTKLRFAVDQRSRLIGNMKNNPLVTVSFFAAGAYYAVYGRAAIVQEKLDEVPIKLACLDIDIEEVRNALFYGSRISVLPEYEKTYDKRAADKLDNQVFSAMKKA